MGDAAMVRTAARQPGAAELDRGGVLPVAAGAAVSRWHRPAFLPQGRRLSEPVWQQRHRGLTWLLAAQVPALFAFGLIRGYGASEAAVEVSVVALSLIPALMPHLSRNVRSASTSLGLVISASVLVHLAGGAIEAHFEFFVVLAFLALYQAWMPFLLALLYVVGEHGIVGVLYPDAVYNNPSDIAHPWKWAAVHGGFVLAASFANLLSWRLTEDEALHDSLTGLPNRVSLLDALEKALDGRSRSGAAVLFIDLDNFKDANDAFGHHIGDEVLIALGRRLSRQLRPGDVLARLGGDEFAILISTLATSTRVDAAEAKATGERLLGAFNSPIVIGDITITVLASMGLALADETTTSTDLLRNADLAMYEAKRAGGGRLSMYAPAMHTAVVQRTELEAELRTALDADELVLHYQPIVALRGERVVGTEALIRWQHPVRGLIPPADFIGVAEQSGLIVSLGAWVIRTACAQTARWQAYAPDEAPLTVAVNLSPIQLLDRTLVATVAEALHDSGLDPSSLCLEITEGSMIKDFDIAVPTLHALRTLGVSLALDDFGTGHSSLSYLQRLPVSSVKIDRSFVGNLEHESPNAQIVLAIIKLAHTLGLSVTAEGVETQVQLDIVTAMGSDTAQGFFFGRPVEAAVLTEVLRQRAACPAKPLRAHDRVTSSVPMP